MSRLPVIFAVVWDDIIVCDDSSGETVPVTRMGREEAGMIMRSNGADGIEPYFPMTDIQLLRAELEDMRSAAAEDPGFAAAQRVALAAVNKLIEKSRD